MVEKRFFQSAEKFWKKISLNIFFNYFFIDSKVHPRSHAPRRLLERLVLAFN